jgi:hypothetical protein
MQRMPLAQSCHPGLPQSSAIQFPAATDRYRSIHHVCVEHLIVSSAPGALSLAAAVNDAKVQRAHGGHAVLGVTPSADAHQYRADAAYKCARRKCCSRCVRLVYFACPSFHAFPSTDERTFAEKADAAGGGASSDDSDGATMCRAYIPSMFSHRPSPFPRCRSSGGSSPGVKEEAEQVTSCSERKLVACLLAALLSTALCPC